MADQQQAQQGSHQGENGECGRRRLGRPQCLGSRHSLRLIHDLLLGSQTVDRGHELVDRLWVLEPNHRTPVPGRGLPEVRIHGRPDPPSEGLVAFVDCDIIERVPNAHDAESNDRSDRRIIQVAERRVQLSAVCQLGCRLEVGVRQNPDVKGVAHRVPASGCVLLTEVHLIDCIDVRKAPSDQHRAVEVEERAPVRSEDQRTREHVFE